MQESRRRSSYQTWLHMTHPEKLIQSGFFYCGMGDIVQCFSCGLRLHKWKIVDIPDVEHVLHSPTCKYMREKNQTDDALYKKVTLILVKQCKEMKEKIQRLENRSYRTIWTEDEVDIDSVPLLKVEEEDVES